MVALLLTTMFLSDPVNNAAAVVLMASIALNVAEGLGAFPDPFLVAVAIAGSCAFLISHRSPIERDGARTGRLQVRRLLAAGSDSGTDPRDGRRAAATVAGADVRMRAWDTVKLRVPSKKV